MKRVSTMLARGIVLAAALAVCGPLESPTPRPVDRALSVVRSQDYSPAFTLAGRRIQGYFTEDRIDAFLEEVFGIAGKWKAMTWSRECYVGYLRERFEAHLFNPREFREILDRIQADYTYTARTAENRVLAAVYADVRVDGPKPAFEAFRANYRSLAAALTPQVLGDLGVNVASIAGSEAAAVILTAALTSAGILGGTTATGLAAGAATFGVALAVGLVVAIVLEATVGEAYEDAARMRIRASLNDLRNRIVDGVYAALERAVRAHRRLQEACVVRMYGGNRDDVLAVGR